VRGVQGVPHGVPHGVPGVLGVELAEPTGDAPALTA